MWVSKFLDKKATIKRKTTTVSAGGVSSVSETTIYTNIGCQIYEVNGRVYDSSLAVYTNEWKMNMIVWPENTNLKQQDIVYITDPYIGTVKKYEIQSDPKMNLLKWQPDSLQFIIESL